MERTFSLHDLKQTRFYQEAKEEGRQQGIDEGRREGIDEGRLQAKLEFVPRLIKFGLTVEQIVQVLNLEVTQIEQAAQQANNELRGN